MRSGSDPITEDPTELDVRADQDESEKRWGVFVLNIRNRIKGESLPMVLYDIGVAYWACRRQVMDDNTSEQSEICDFAAAEDWDGVFLALARAVRQRETTE